MADHGLLRRSWPWALALVLLILGGCAAGVVAGTAARGPRPVASAPAASSAVGARKAPVARTAVTGADVFGVNEAVTIPRPWIERGLVAPEREEELLADDARLARDLGVRIVRGPTQVYPYLDHLSLERSGWDFARADRWVRTVQAAGLEPQLMVGPWPGNQTANYTRHYVPEDMDAYTAYVRRVVERYDGDGVEDMPGLVRGVRYWEVDNEPDLHNSRPPRSANGRGGVEIGADPRDFQTPAQYAEVLIASARAIRAAHPDALVLNAGFFSIKTPEGDAYVRALAEIPGVRDAVDVFSVHCYFEQDSLDPVSRTLAVAHDTFPGTPIWVTETSVPARGEPEWQDEEWQARMVVAIHGAFLAGGADRVFWHTLADPPPRAGARATLPFSTNSLLRVLRDPIDRGGVGGPRVEDKPAGAVYRRLAATLAGANPADLREEVAEGGRLLWTGDGWVAFWGTPRTPEGAGDVTDLLTGETRPPARTVTAPAFVSARP